MREVRMSYRLTETDLYEARKKAKFPRARDDGSRVILLLILLIALLYATPALWDWLSGNDHPQSLARQIVVGGAPWVYVIGWLVLTTRMNRKTGARRIYESMPSYHLEHAACLSDEGLAIETPCTTQRYQWSMVVGFRETPEWLLFFLSSASFNFLPKRALPAGTDMEALREAIGERINSFGLAPEEYARQRALRDAPALLPRLHFTLTPAEFVRARRSDGRTRWVEFGRDLLILVPLFVVMVWLLVSSGLEGGDSILWMFLASFFVLVIVQVVLQTRRWRRATHLHGPQTVDITETGLRFSTPASAQWIGWGAIARYRRAKKIFTIHLRDGTMRCIPERAFLTAESAGRFAELLQSSVTPNVGFAVVVDAPH